MIEQEEAVDLYVDVLMYGCTQAVCTSVCKEIYGVGVESVSDQCSEGHCSRSSSSRNRRACGWEWRHGRVLGLGEYLPLVASSNRYTKEA